MLFGELLGGGFSASQAAAILGQEVSLTAAGNSQATATLVTASMVIVAGADGTKGLVLPNSPAGDEIWIFNNSASTCPVYPDVGAAISVAGTGLGTTNAAFSQLTFKAALYKRFTATQWIAVVTA